MSAASLAAPARSPRQLVEGRSCLTVGKAGPSPGEGEDSRTRAEGSGSGGGGAFQEQLRNSASDRRLRRRRSPSAPPPPPSFTLRRRTKPRWQPPQRPRAPFTPLAAFVSRSLLRPSAGAALFSLPFPHPESQVPRAGTLPFSVSSPLTHLASVLPPFSVPGAGRSRSTDGKSRSCHP